MLDKPFILNPLLPGVFMQIRRPIIQNVSGKKTLLYHAHVFIDERLNNLYEIGSMAWLKIVRIRCIKDSMLKKVKT